MRVLLVAYTSAGNNYKEFAISLRKLGEKWWHYMDHIWLLKTDKTAEEVGSALAEMAKADGGNLLVIEVTGRAQGRLPRTSWRWINEHVATDDK